MQEPKASHTYDSPGPGSPSGPVPCTLCLGGPGVQPGALLGVLQKAPLPSGRWRENVLSTSLLGSPACSQASPPHFCRPVPRTFPLPQWFPVHLSCPLKCGPWLVPLLHMWPYQPRSGCPPPGGVLYPNCGPGSLQEAAAFLAESPVFS